MTEDPTAKIHIRQLYRDGTARVRMLNEVRTAQIYMIGSNEFPEEAVISIDDPSHDPDHGVYDLNFPQVMKKAGFVLEKKCTNDTLVSFGNSVYIAKAAG